MMVFGWPLGCVDDGEERAANLFWKRCGDFQLLVDDIGKALEFELKGRRTPITFPRKIFCLGHRRSKPTGAAHLLLFAMVHINY